MTIKNISKTILFASLIVTMILPLSGMDFAEAEKLPDDKSLIKEKIKDKMNELSDKDKKERNTDKKYTSEEYGIPYNMIFEDNGKLVVGIDIEKTLDFNEDYTLEEVKADLTTDDDIDVRYYGFVRESHYPTSTNVYGSSMILKSTGENMWQNATITLIRDNNIITTGHLAPGTGTTLYMSCGVGNIICSGTVSSNPNANPQGADAALVTTSSSYLNLQENQIKYGATTYSVTDGTSSDITQYASVKMAGFTTPTSSGYILDVDATVRDSNGILNDQVIASYPSGDGDSGSPVFITTGTTTAKIIGQHVGKFCEVDLHSGINYAQWCSDTITGEGALTVFSSWLAVKQNLGIN